MMSYIALLLVLILLIKDMPFINRSLTAKTKKLFNRGILITGIIHGLYQWLLIEQLSKIISGIFLFGLVIIYMMAGKHDGIEDKVARQVFKKIAWVIILLVALLHIMI